MKSNINSFETYRIDWSQLNYARFVLKDGFEETVDIYLHNASKLYRELEKAMIDGDMVSARNIAHKLKSSSANIGCTAVSEIAGYIEDSIRVGKNSMEIEGAMIPLKESLHHMNGELHNMLKAA